MVKHITAHLQRLVVAGLSLVLLSGISAGPARAQSAVIEGPAGSGAFGSSVTVLPNGNFVVTDPGFDKGAIRDVGAVYLYQGTTHALLSTLTGSTAADSVGAGGVTVLANGNYLVASRYWDNGPAVNAGAVTWGSGSSGISGELSSANSLVGSRSNDRVGIREVDVVGNTVLAGITSLPNGNYVVCSPNWDSGAVANAGAVTWGNGVTGTHGPVSATNSLIGGQPDDLVGLFGVAVLPDGNYIVSSCRWSNGFYPAAGAVTWASGQGGTCGAVSAANSLVGARAYDQVGSAGITVLPNGNYVVSSPGCANGTVSRAGAVTWGNGRTGTSGVVSTANSLVGYQSEEQLGQRGVVALANGHYVVSSPNWSTGFAYYAGAVTWCDGTTGRSGIISAANSLVGTQANDQVSGVTALTNGHYVVSSAWSNGAAHGAGAVTWCDGTTGRSGAVSAANSLVGTRADDRVGGVTALANGNYVVSSPFWDNGAVADVGAVTWADGRTGTTGAVSRANSLVGTQANDGVGEAITALPNGHYLVHSPSWNNGETKRAGAATWADGRSNTSGIVSAANSLVGSHEDDRIGGLRGETARLLVLTNGNYVLSAPYWNNGSVEAAGAVTWGHGSSSTTGVVSAANSLVGSRTNDRVGGFGVTALTNGNYVVNSYDWSNGSAQAAGAVTWGNGRTGTSGPVSSANSLVGVYEFARVGYGGVAAEPDGNYVILSMEWDNFSILSGGNAGAVTWGNGRTGTSGSLSSCNSIVGVVGGGGGKLYPEASRITFGYQAATATLLGGLPAENRIISGFGPPAAPAGAASQLFRAGATVAELVVVGAAIKWYAAAAGTSRVAEVAPQVAGTTYYASQTVRGCESTDRLAVTVASPLATGPAGRKGATVRVYPIPTHPNQPLTVFVPAVPGASQVTGSLVNSLGQVVRMLPTAALPAAGVRLVVATTGLAGGVYVLQLRAGPACWRTRVLLE